MRGRSNNHKIVTICQMFIFKWCFRCRLSLLGSLRSYDANCNENVTLKLNFALSILQLFHVGHLVQNRRSALLLAWHEWISCKGKESNERFTARVVVKTSNMKISRRRLADYVKTLYQKACRACSTIIFLHSTNQIIDVWRCCCRCRRRILNTSLSLKVS